jgi:glyceraldehyde-3-phosphate dehydrogenase/erythrose-4-phosphate dehydrogenase
VPGVNEQQYDRDRHHVVSMASCTTNSLAPDAASTQVLNRRAVKILSWYDNETGYSRRMVEYACRL